MKTDPTPETNSRAAWWLLAGLGLFIIALLGVLLNYRTLRATYLLPPATLTYTASPTETPTPVPTETRTPRPTWTLSPSKTPTITPTETGTATPTRPSVPTLTPALPYKFNDRYDLEAPSPELAQRITILMRQLPDLLYDTPEERQAPAYHQSFKYAAIAYQEALLRYPDAPQVTAWQWGLAYSQAQTGSSAAGRAYASLVNLALNEENIPLDSLPVWFHTQEQDLTLALHPLDKPSGAPEYHLLEIQPGDMYLLARVSTGETTISPLFDAFNFEGETSSAFTFDDLTGDGIPELAFYRQEARDTRLHDPLVFDLTGASPAPLPVEQSTPLDIKMGFSVAIECPSCTGPQARVLQLNASIFPACPLSAMRSYQWDGSLFRSQATVFNAHPVVANLAYCETIRTHAADFLPASANLALLQALQPHWPPPLDLGGRLYPADSQAELAYHVGIYQALSGDSIASLETFQALSRQDNSEWSAAAAQFLQQYQNGARLIRACLTAPGCSPSLAIQQVLGNSSSGDLDAALRLLRQSGLDTIANGQFDFNRDEQAEYWFTLRARPGQALEFWILVLTPGGVKPVFVDFVEESKPPIYFSIAFGSDSVFQFEGRQGYALRLTRENQAPYIESFAVEPVLTTYTRDRLAQAESSLFSGTPADTVASQMEEVLASGRFNCLTGRICDRFDYMLGLAYELSGRDRDAIDTYIKLWWENKSSPFTAMARSKLIFYPPITPGPSPTPTRTITSTPTAGPSPTLGPSPTEEPYPYPEPTEETPYPYP